jgi:hypothetical protein
LVNGLIEIENRTRATDSKKDQDAGEEMDGGRDTALSRTVLAAFTL